MSVVHARVVFNFLDVLANVGGVQLVGQGGGKRR